MVHRPKNRARRWQPETAHICAPPCIQQRPSSLHPAVTRLPSASSSCQCPYGNQHDTHLAKPWQPSTTHFSPPPWERHRPLDPRDFLMHPSTLHSIGPGPLRFPEALPPSPLASAQTSTHRRSCHALEKKCAVKTMYSPSPGTRACFLGRGFSDVRLAEMEPGKSTSRSVRREVKKT
jgi:hypothetical protein